MIERLCKLCMVAGCNASPCQPQRAAARTKPRMKTAIKIKSTAQTPIRQKDISRFPAHIQAQIVEKLNGRGQ